jgi:hypothetical protein
MNPKGRKGGVNKQQCHKDGFMRQNRLKEDGRRYATTLKAVYCSKNEATQEKRLSRTI